jgi:hypothetical protein
MRSGATDCLRALYSRRRDTLEDAVAHISNAVAHILLLPRRLPRRRRMKSLKAGAVLLSIWSSFNLLVAVMVTAMTVTGQPPPALSLLFTDIEIRGLDNDIIAVVNAQATLANPSVFALCIVVLAIIWKGLLARARWAFWSLAVALVPLQVFGFVSDAFLGHRNLVANVVSTLVLTAGLGLSGYALRRTVPLTSQSTAPDA